MLHPTDKRFFSGLDSKFRKRILQTCATRKLFKDLSPPSPQSIVVCIEIVWQNGDEFQKLHTHGIPKHVTSLNFAKEKLLYDANQAKLASSLPTEMF